MVKTPKLDEPIAFGVLTNKLPQEPGDIVITPGAEVIVRHQGNGLSVIITEVVEPQSVFIGRAKGFDNYALEHGEVKIGDLMQFDYDKIERIYSWIKEDQP